MTIVMQKLEGSAMLVSRTNNVGVAAYLALFFLVLGSRWFLIAAYGHDLPFGDEWDAGAANLYAPYAADSLDLGQLLSPHNEHRLVTSRLLGLLTFELAGGWSPRFQMMVNATIWAGFAVWLASVLAQLVPVGSQLPLIVITALAFSLPLDVEVSLMGMNAHFYLVIIFSLVALKLLVNAREFGLSWWSGLLCAVLAFLSMSSGAVTTVVASVTLVLQIITGTRAANPRSIVSILVLLAVAFAMWAITPTIAGHDVYRAHSIAEFISALIAISAAPLITPAGTAFVQWPLILHAVDTVRRRLPIGNVEWFGLAMAGWVAAQMMSIALFRTATPLLPRYLDIVVVALPLGVAVILKWAPQRRRWYLLGGAWVFVVLFAASGLSYISTLRLAREAHNTLSASQVRLKSYLLTGNVSDLEAVRFVYPDPIRLSVLLSSPDIQRILPDGIRPVDGPSLESSDLLLKSAARNQISVALSLLPVLALVASCLGVSFFALTLLSSGRAATVGRSGSSPSDVG